MEKTNVIDAGDLELKSSQEEKKSLSNKLDEIFRPSRKKYSIETISRKEFDEQKFTKFICEYLTYFQYFFNKIEPRGTGEIQDYFGEKFLYEENLIKLDERLRDYSEQVVGLPDNWDGQGSKAITIETWNYTTTLLRKVLYNLWYNGFNVSIPLVLPNTDGSFDIDWETEIFELLVSIPTNKEELIHIYGEKFGYPEYELEARINYELVQGVVVEWMKKIL